MRQSSECPQSTMTSGAYTDRAGYRILEFQPKMHCGERLQVFGPVITDGPLLLVILVRRETVVEIRHGPPSKFARLIDAALQQGLLNELLSLPTLMIIVAGQDHRTNTRPIR